MTPKSISKYLFNIRKEFYKDPHTVSRIQPDRKWFGNVRTIDQKSLEKFRVEMEQ